nr:putative oligopeptide transporter [Quercus suber]
MAPDRGHPHGADTSDSEEETQLLRHETSRSIAQEPIGQEPDADFLARRSEQPQFTIRALLAGLFIGVLIAFSNTYFGLQTGWISGMAMPSALIGFAYFKGLRTLTSHMGEVFGGLGFGLGFSEVENVLVQTVAGSVGTMPLGCGFVGVIPALEFLLKSDETPESASQDTDIILALQAAQDSGGLRLPLGKLMLWALGLCFFGVMFAVPLRKEVIIREKLRFPSGTATALMIGVLHGGEKTGVEGQVESTARQRRSHRAADDEEGPAQVHSPSIEAPRSQPEGIDSKVDSRRDWKKQIRLLTTFFGISGIYVGFPKEAHYDHFADLI